MIELIPKKYFSNVLRYLLLVLLAVSFIPEFSIGEDLLPSCTPGPNGTCQLSEASSLPAEGTRDFSGETTSEQPYTEAAVKAATEASAKTSLNTKDPKDWAPRDAQLAEMDWKGDSMAAMGAPISEIPSATDVKVREAGDSGAPNWQEFHKCFDPHIVEEEKDEKAPEYNKKTPGGKKVLDSEQQTPRCPYCQPRKIYLTKEDCEKDQPAPNHGEVWEYWWPEWQIELNRFGVSAINPAENLGIPNYEPNTLLQAAKTSAVGKAYDQFAKTLGLSSGYNASQVEGTPAISGNYTGGTTPGKQNEMKEFHTYKTFVTKINHTKEETRDERGITGRYYVKFPRPVGCKPIKFHYDGYIAKAKGEEKSAKMANLEAFKLAAIMKQIFINEAMAQDQLSGGGSSNPDENKSKANEECFYDSLPDFVEKGPGWGAWSEDARYMPFWRNPELSYLMDQEARNFMGGKCGSGGCGGGSKKGGGGGMKMPKMPGGGKGGGGGGGGEDYYSSEYYRSSSSINSTADGCIILNGKLYCPVSSSSSSLSASSLGQSSSSANSGSSQSNSSNSNSSDSSVSASCAVIDGEFTCTTSSQSSAMSGSGSVSSATNSTNSTSSVCRLYAGRYYCEFTSSSAYSFNNSIFNTSSSFHENIFNSSYSFDPNVYNSSLNASSIGGLVNAFNLKSNKAVAKTKVNNNTQPSASQKSLQLKDLRSILAGDSVEAGIEKSATDFVPATSISDFDVCAGCRMANWPETLQGLDKMMAVEPIKDPLCLKYCYPNGGSKYPLDGNLMGFHHTITGDSVRYGRTLELLNKLRSNKSALAQKNFLKSLAAKPKSSWGSIKLKSGDRLTDSMNGISAKGDIAIPHNTDNVDKLQLVYPKVSKCMNITVPPTGGGGGSSAGSGAGGNSSAANQQYTMELWSDKACPACVQFANNYRPSYSNYMTITSGKGKNPNQAGTIPYSRLSDSNGKVVWQGDPRNASEVARVMGISPQALDARAAATAPKINYDNFPNEFNEEWGPNEPSEDTRDSVRFMFWNKRAICSCQYRSVVKKNDEKSDGWKKAKDYFKDNKKEACKEGEESKPFHTCDIRYDEPKGIKALKEIGKLENEDWGCQAYDGIEEASKEIGMKKYDKWGQGDENPDRIRGKQKTDLQSACAAASKENPESQFTCAAFQVYPFKLDFQSGKQCNDILKDCRKAFEIEVETYKGDATTQKEDQKKEDDELKEKLEKAGFNQISESLFGGSEGSGSETQ